MSGRQTAYVSKSMVDSTPRFPNRVHIIKSLDLCFCGKGVGGAIWVISQVDPPTCKECIEKAMQEDK